MFDGAVVITVVLPLAELLLAGTGALLVPLDAAEVVTFDVELLATGVAGKVAFVSVML